MEKINKFLLMAIAMMVIMITAVGIDRGLKYYEAQKWEKERVARYEQARADVTDMQLTISELSKDQEAIEAFIEENREYFEEESYLDEFEDELLQADNKEAGMADQARQDVSGNLSTDVSGNGKTDVSGNMEGDVSGSFGPDVSGNMEMDVSGNNGMDVSGNSGNDVSGNNGMDVSGNGSMDVSGNTGMDVSGNAGMDVSGNGQMDMPDNPAGSVSGNSLAEKRKIRGSYMETQMQNDIDQKIIAESDLDFSDISIACLGDSITQGSNLENLENYQQYAYPVKLKEILGAKSVANLGIGGSSIGRYWENAFVDRYQEIPADTNLIIVMGGTNDGFCLTQEELGTVKERKANTFIGDLDELMRGLKENYPDATIVFATPLPNVLHDVLKKERDYLLPQLILVNAIKYLAGEYEIPVIDLYNSNILDTHDAAVIYNYMPDGVHCNQDGYTILAEHFAAELIKLYEQENEQEYE